MKHLVLKSILLFGLILVGINILNRNLEKPIDFEEIYYRLSVKKTEKAIVSNNDIELKKPKSNTTELKVIQTPKPKEIVKQKVQEYPNVKESRFNDFMRFDSDKTLKTVEELKPSELLYVVISDMEGFAAVPVNCGGYAIGYGHAIQGKEVEYYFENPISREKALNIFIKDVNDKAEDVREYFKGQQMTQGEFDALVSICYNTGYGNFKKKELTKMILSKLTTDKQDFINTISAKNKRKYPGLIDRRIREYYIYNGSYFYINKHNLLSSLN